MTLLLYVMKTNYKIYDIQYFLCPNNSTRNREFANKASMEFQKGENPMNKISALGKQHNQL